MLGEAWYHIGVRGIAAAFLVSVIGMITGCAASHPPPAAAPAESEYAWTDYHDGKEPTVPPVAKTEAPAPAPEAAKSEEPVAKVAQAESDDEPAPKVVKKKKKGHKKASQAAPTSGTSDNVVMKKRPRKRAKKPQQVDPT